MKFVWRQSLWIILLIMGYQLSGQAAFEMRGMTMVAPPRPISSMALHEIRHTNSNWVALVPYAFQRGESCQVQYNHNGRWWGENVQGVQESIQHAQAAGLKVMLKPQVYIRSKWTGDIDCGAEQNWKTWEESYKAYIMLFAKMAQENEVELFCLGTELKNPIAERPEFFRNLIRDIKQVYTGKLTYAANWDDYDRVPFWEELDYIGVNAYCPLTDSSTPDVKELDRKWKPYIRDMEKYANKKGRKILFTEYGYLSIDACAWKPWEVQYELDKHQVNEVAQANAFECLFRNLSGKTWWAGGFIWKWYPGEMGHEGHMPKDFTPQNKLAQQVIEKWYCR